MTHPALPLIEHAIRERVGHQFSIRSTRVVSGGDINDTVVVADGAEHYFVKLGKAERLPMYEAEVDGLLALAATGCMRTPAPIACGDDGNKVYIDVQDETADILAILEDRERLSVLISALNKLAPDDRELWNCLVNKVKKQDIADRFNLTLDGVYYREKRIKSILCSNETLKSFYTDK